MTTRITSWAFAWIISVAGGSLAGEPDAAFARWLKPQDWQRDSDKPALSLGEKGSSTTSTSSRRTSSTRTASSGCTTAARSAASMRAPTRAGPRTRRSPEKSDQRLFKLGLAKSKDGVHFTRHSADPVFSFGDDIHSVVTAAILKNPDGSVHREDGKLRMYFAAVDFPGGTYKHDLYETTSADGITWAKPTLVDGERLRPVRHQGGRQVPHVVHLDRQAPLAHQATPRATTARKWTIREKPCIVMDQKWEVKDQVYPMVVKADGVYLMLYGCYWNDDKHTALGFAVSKDGLTWTKHPDNPVFRPEPKHDWESNFTTSHTLLRLPDGSFRLWYAGPQAAAVEQPVLRHRHGELDAGKMRGVVAEVVRLPSVPVGTEVSRLPLQNPRFASGLISRNRDPQRRLLIDRHSQNNILVHQPRII